MVHGENVAVRLIQGILSEKMRYINLKPVVQPLKSFSSCLLRVHWCEVFSLKMASYMLELMKNDQLLIYYLWLQEIFDYEVDSDEEWEEEEPGESLSHSEVSDFDK